MLELELRQFDLRRIVGLRRLELELRQFDLRLRRRGGGRRGIGGGGDGGGGRATRYRDADRDASELRGRAPLGALRKLHVVVLQEILDSLDGGLWVFAVCNGETATIHSERGKKDVLRGDGWKKHA